MCKYILALLLAVFVTSSGCAFVALADWGRLPIKADSDDPFEKPGFRRTAIGWAADLGALPFGYLFFPIGCGLMCVGGGGTELGAAGIAPGVALGGFIASAPVFILKGIFVDVPFYTVWIFRSRKSKLGYYIDHIDELSKSENEHMVELAGVDHGDVYITKTLRYWWDVPDAAALRRWREWWKKVRNLPYEEIVGSGPKKSTTEAEEKEEKEEEEYFERKR
ncbi:MAG: hypothetical protein E3J72_06125 [Planctomycetota bacterium]|nr:MAG: hypothetical protein E3J72_06125 [Planctomycetota bacterium]